MLLGNLFIINHSIKIDLIRNRVSFKSIYNLKVLVYIFRKQPEIIRKVLYITTIIASLDTNVFLPVIYILLLKPLGKDPKVAYFFCLLVEGLIGYTVLYNSLYMVMIRNSIDKLIKFIKGAKIR
jgi:hypothetical protein